MQTEKFWEILTHCTENLFYYEGDQALEQIARKKCGICVLGDC